MNINGKVWIAAICLSIPLLTGGAMVKKDDARHFQIDFQNGFYGGELVRVEAEGKVLFEKKIESDLATGYAESALGLTASKNPVALAITVPGKNIRKTVTVDLDKGSYVGISLLDKADERTAQPFEIMQRDDKFWYD
jgi:hypothetical protein